MPSFKLLTVRAVQRIAERLMRANGTTTTLEVRRALRRRGYWAVQDDVSYLMEHLAVTEPWIVGNDGRSRVFALLLPEESADLILLHLLVASTEAEARHFWGEQYAERHVN